MPSYLGHAKRIVPRQLSGKTVTHYQSGKHWDFINSLEVKRRTTIISRIKKKANAILSLGQDYWPN